MPPREESGPAAAACSLDRPWAGEMLGPKDGGRLVSHWRSGRPSPPGAPALLPAPLMPPCGSSLLQLHLPLPEPLTCPPAPSSSAFPPPPSSPMGRFSPTPVIPPPPAKMLPCLAPQRASPDSSGGAVPQLTGAPCRFPPGPARQQSTGIDLYPRGTRPSHAGNKHDTGRVLTYKYKQLGLAPLANYTGQAVEQSNSPRQQQPVLTAHF